MLALSKAFRYFQYSIWSWYGYVDVYLETVVSNNTDEGDDCVQNCKEGQCGLHVASTLL